MDKQQKVFQKLNELNIIYEVFHHPAAFTIEEIDMLGLNDKGDIVKNLFLRDDKGKNHFLVVLEKNKTVDLVRLRSQLGSTRLGFASEERLEKYLQLSKGSVSPFGVINDKLCSVTVVIDKDLISRKKLGIHPNDNTATVFISFDDLIRVIEENGNKIIYMEI
jgi:Ala-tRNA(Pro) deacylase